MTPGHHAPQDGHGLIPTIDAALRAVDTALARDMQTADGEPAASRLARLRTGLLAMRDRGVVDPDQLRHMIRNVANWAPQDDVTLLSALGAVARARG